MMETLSPPTSPPGDRDRRSRPRAFSTLSHESKRSRRSSGSAANKLELIETSKDKRRLNSKADPSIAMNEAQPGMDVEVSVGDLVPDNIGLATMAIIEETNLDSLRSVTHRDHRGNIISEYQAHIHSTSIFSLPADAILLR